MDMNCQINRKLQRILRGAALSLLKLFLGLLLKSFLKRLRKSSLTLLRKSSLNSNIQTSKHPTASSIYKHTPMNDKSIIVFG